MKEIATAGLCAPSAENYLCLEFSERCGHLLIWRRATYYSAPPHRQLLMLISFGAVVENVVLRAARLGLSTSVEWHIHSDDGPIADIAFSASSACVTDMDTAIEARHTNRGLVFRGPRLTAERRAHLGAAASSVDGVRLVWLDEPPLRARALSIVRKAETERFRVQALHAELFMSLRFDVGWNHDTDEGIAPGTLGVEPPFRPLFEWLRHWDNMRVANRLGADRLLGIRAAWLPCRLAPHRCAIIATLDPRASAIAAGRALQRIWLRATAFGLAFQPLAAGAVFAWAEQPDVRPATRSALVQAWSALGVGERERPMIVFRLGYASPPPVRSERGTAEAYWRQSLI